MKKALRKQTINRLTGMHDGITGVISPELRGDITGLRGNISGLMGNITGLRGDISPELRGEISPELRGYITGLRGEISPDLRGNIDDCELTPDDRKKGVDIKDLIL